MANEDKYIGKILDDRYEILEVIGTGGMAVVYKALCHRLNRYVAVKVLKDELASNEEFRRRFHTESQAVAMLSHPNIVAVYDVSHTDEMEYIVMELIEGLTLKQYMEKRGALTWKETLHFALQITKALSHAHSRGIIHRDIKPHNIMILRDGSVKVADFGIARLQTIQTEISITRDAIGSVHYISPEQAKGEQVDERTDIYSLGVVMYEMLTGRRPFEGDSPVAVAIQHINSMPLTPSEINPEVPHRLEEICMKAMNPSLSERYQTVDEMLDDLEDFRKNPEQEPEVLSPSIVGSVNVPDEPKEPVPAAPKSEAFEPEIEKAGKTDRARPKGKQRADDYVREEYMKNAKKVRKVSTLTGVLCILVFLVAMFVFLYNFWLKDVFSSAEYMELPNFVDSKLSTVLSNSYYSESFNFTYSYESNEDYPEDTVIAQDPVAGRQVVKSDKKIDVKLTVSKGTSYISMPDVVGAEYRTATIRLENSKLVVRTEREASDTIPEGQVIRTIPEAGEQILPDATVYIIVSSGRVIEYIKMPKLTGLTLNEAILAIEEAGLAVGNVGVATDDAAIGTVITQSSAVGVDIAKGTTIDLTVSGG